MMITTSFFLSNGNFAKLRFSIKESNSLYIMVINLRYVALSTERFKEHFRYGKELEWNSLRTVNEID